MHSQRSSRGGDVWAARSSIVPNARWRVVRTIQAQDRIYPIIVQLKPSRASLLVRPDTDLVIEGAPRSANTFLLSCCELLNPQARIAHHMHLASQIQRAHRFQVPCVVLIRDPFDAGASNLVWAPNRRPKDVVVDWIRFYERSLPYADGFLAVNFVTAIEKPGWVLRQVNRRFGTAFNDGYGTEITRDDVLERVDERARDFDGAVYDNRVARPSSSAERRKQSDAAHERLARDVPGDLRRRARELYERYDALVVRDGSDESADGNGTSHG